MRNYWENYEAPEIADRYRQTSEKLNGAEGSEQGDEKEVEETRKRAEEMRSMTPAEFVSSIEKVENEEVIRLIKAEMGDVDPVTARNKENIDEEKKSNLEGFSNKESSDKSLSKSSHKSSSKSGALISLNDNLKQENQDVEIPQKSSSEPSKPPSSSGEVSGQQEEEEGEDEKFENYQVDQNQQDSNQLPVEIPADLRIPPEVRSPVKTRNRGGLQTNTQKNTGAAKAKTGKQKQTKTQTNQNSSEKNAEGEKASKTAIQRPQWQKNFAGENGIKETEKIVWVRMVSFVELRMDF